MAYRKFDTNTWQDPWFEDLNPKEKLAFIYLWTNEICTQAGIYEISEKRIRFELGYGIDTVYEALKDKVEWYPDQKIIHVKNFFRRQCQNGKFAISALNSIKEDLFKLQLFINQNREILDNYKVDLTPYLDTISIPYPTETEQNRTEADTVTEAEADTDTEQTFMPSSVKPKLDLAGMSKEIFDYWKHTLHHPRAKLDEIRKNKIYARLKDGYTVDDIKIAIDGCLASPYHQGENERSTVYDDIELICRDGKHVDQFIKSANEPDARLISAKGRQARKNGQTWLEMRQNARKSA